MRKVNNAKKGTHNILEDVMRFLSKFIICSLICCVAIILSQLISSRLNVIANNIKTIACESAVQFGVGEVCDRGVFDDIKSLLNSEINSEIVKGVDNTIFKLRYDGKVWEYEANDFKLTSNIFTIDARINAYNRSGDRESKITLLNHLINIKISPEISFNYIYHGFNKKIEKIEKNIEKLPKNAKIIIKKTKLDIVPEVVGVKLDKYKLYKMLIEKYQQNNIVDLEIPTIKTLPQTTSETLKQTTYKRSEFSTSIATSSPSRKNNIRRAVNSINGTKLGKKEKFSFNQCVGKRTESSGYTQAKIIVDGEFVEGIGGGVCQVSSTIYNAAILAGLDIISSQKHSKPVGYVKAGFDAMVNYGSSDLMFQNNTEGDIYLVASCSGDSIKVCVYGCDIGKIYYERENEKLDEVEPQPQEIIVDLDGKYLDKVKYKDESFELKPAKKGYTIKSYRLKYLDGELVEKLLLRVDKYLPQHRVLVYGGLEREIGIVNNDNNIA